MFEPERFEQYKFVIGIEFGAISSGISIAHKNRSVDVYTINNKASSNKRLRKQIPTSILYKGGDINDPQKVKCGVNSLEVKIAGDDIYITNIKEIAFGYKQATEDDGDTKLGGLTFRKIVADYLRGIHQIVLKNMENFKFDEKHKALFDAFKAENARYCVACPPQQESFLGQCFIDAGIIKDKIELEYRLDFITESEATAYNLLQWDRTLSEIKPSENYLVCNLGYTTMGISEIKAETTERLSQVRLVDEYRGEGSMLLDNAFLQLIETLSLDKKTFATLVEKFVSEKKYGFSEMSVEETLDELEVTEKSEGKTKNGSDFDALVTTKELSEKVFKPVIDKFMKNILSSIEKGEKKNGAIYKRIYLTGRYGSETYFIEKLMAVEDGKYKKAVVSIEYEVIDSVSRGAVHYAMRKKSAQIPFFDAQEGSLSPVEKPKNLTPKLSECDLIVGIDFGTTYTGIAYSAPGPGREITSIKTWPYQSADSPSKCPSVIVYDKNFSNTYRWGEEATNKKTKDNERKLELFKLSLSPLATLEYYKGESESKIQELQKNFYKKGLTADKVIIDFLKEILKHARSKHFNKSKEGKAALGKLGQFSGKQLDIVYILTVPAMWDEGAKRTMVEAAFKSKLITNPDNLMIITEPEAAAISYEKVLTNEERENFKTFLVCDAGGGTVDLVSFRMERDANEELIIRQLCEGNGGLCGSTILDRNFEKFIWDFYKNELDVQVNRNILDLSNVIKYFRSDLKLRFDYCKTNPGSEQIQLPDEPELKYASHHSFKPGTNNQVLLVSRQVLAERVFDPVIDQVIDLIHTQMEKLRPNQPDVILLVGGFSASKYLTERLRQEFRPKGIEIKNHPEPLTAISEGAVSYAQNPRMISSKLIGLSYAIEVKTQFQNNLDSLENKIEELDNLGETVYYSRSRLEYFVYCGDSAKKNSLSVYKRRVYVEYPNNAIIAIFTSQSKPSELEDKSALRYVNPELHTKSMEISLDMPIIPTAKLREKIPFLISLEIDEITGAKVIVECERENVPPYEVFPKVSGKPLVYISNNRFIIKPKKKSGFGAFFESATKG